MQTNNIAHRGGNLLNRKRLDLLLSSHQAGNSAGMKEFHALLNKLLKQKRISKNEYDTFIKQWPV